MPHQGFAMPLPTALLVLCMNMPKAMVPPVQHMPKYWHSAPRTWARFVIRPTAIQGAYRDRRQSWLTSPSRGRRACMPQHAEPETLRTLGNWDVLEKIADSGIGSVFKARSRVTGERVLVKVMP